MIRDRPVPLEFTKVLALDGSVRFITLVSAETQTDWEWVQQRTSFSCQVQKEIEDPQLLQAEVEPGNEMKPELEHNPWVGLPHLLAYRPEQKQTPRFKKVPEVKSKQHVLLAHLDRYQQLVEGQAKEMRELISEERENLAQMESERKIEVNPQEREAAKEQAKKRLRRLQLQKKTEKDNLKMDLSRKESQHTMSSSPSKDIPNINDEQHIPQLDISTTDGEPKCKDVFTKFYKSGKCFITLCPDGTGNVFYPSGKAAIIISSAKAANFTYIILEDKDVAPSIKGIFTNDGHATCCHPNGMMWLNLTPAGGLCFSETGALCRRWNWLYRCGPHVRDLPFKPLTLALGPHMSVRIHSQKCLYITFAYQQNSVRFNVGSELELIYPESHDQPGQDRLSGQMEEEKSPEKIKAYVN
ncbi:hypothetical protein VZT92_005278 [Zoarces viviparus]|uniref:FAM194 C-terminal domain-containing protein n=1 Tax=Zoarces viviparus TaxID=48416 RepID=A0AAW1FTL0_ZOAVI